MNTTVLKTYNVPLRAVQLRLGGFLLHRVLARQLRRLRWPFRRSS